MQYLVPHDLSRESDRIVRWAARSASRTASGVTILHVANKADLEVRERLEHAEEIALASGASQVSTVIRNSDTTSSGIISAEDDCDLLVLGVRQKRQLKDMFLGNTTLRVVKRSNKDICALPHKLWQGNKEPRSLRTARSILVGVDFSPHSIYAVRLVDRWAQAAGRISLVHVVSPKSTGAVLHPKGSLSVASASQDELEALKRNASNKLYRLRSVMGRRNRCDLMVTVGSPGHALSEISAGYDLLVVGAQRNDDDKPTEAIRQLLRHCPKPMYMAYSPR